MKKKMMKVMRSGAVAVWCITIFYTSFANADTVVEFETVDNLSVVRTSENGHKKLLADGSEIVKDGDKWYSDGREVTIVLNRIVTKDRVSQTSSSESYAQTKAEIFPTVTISETMSTTNTKGESSEESKQPQISETSNEGTNTTESESKETSTETTGATSTEVIITGTTETSSTETTETSSTETTETSSTETENSETVQKTVIGKKHMQTTEITTAPIETTNRTSKKMSSSKPVGKRNEQTEKEQSKRSLQESQRTKDEHQMTNRTALQSGESSVPEVSSTQKKGLILPKTNESKASGITAIGIFVVIIGLFLFRIKGKE
ncbi:LPXTG-domain-containing protein cell wall anchor domain [Enterococcus phoeniculicola]|jgi:LPXTG-motif cell wall-anchored protein|uniref:LPXTG-domain-containing protein cell wall anchor domain n=1 Tax=Enterococcus phoeniculicola ATCC BAA-412 TaxID=1158610 RepID=R3TWL9_9ENTE|nr:LPXTG cell wall anchor domain-containing protein [Enterococcus phoeniculicola]EOL45513.1 LPXTG-domain-containing protein cell wall anchor domain [Enterococcus phoeniculicola ATCC BAA-412]EOT74875.1 hypothetical protein I589_02475 [Enterococcus phoeniculicola ATCC BAA-412]OJG73684.1 LPXTG-domain-containing protein cell wall anchor domain [Enterococcus phoeniculicola]